MSDKSDEVITTIIGAILFTLSLIGTILAISVTHGFVLSALWGWYIVPLGLPAIGIVHAIGLALLVRYLTYHHNKCKRETEEENPISKLVARVFVYPIAVLFIGWLIHIFI